MNEQQINALKDIRLKKANHFCSITKDATIQLNDTLYLTSLHDVIPREVTYRKNDKQNIYQLVGQSIIYHSTDKYITSTHEWIQHTAQRIIGTIDMICTSSQEATFAHHRLIQDEIQYVNHLPSIKSIRQYINVNQSSDPKIKRAIHQRLEKLHKDADLAMTSWGSLLHK